MCFAAFPIVKICRCPSVDKEDVLYSARECYIREEENMMNLEDGILNELRQTKEDKDCMTTITSGI